MNPPATLHQPDTGGEPGDSGESRHSRVTAAVVSLVTRGESLQLYWLAVAAATGPASTGTGCNHACARYMGT